MSFRPCHFPIHPNIFSLKKNLSNKFLYCFSFFKHHFTQVNHCNTAGDYSNLLYYLSSIQYNIHKLFSAVQFNQTQLYFNFTQLNSTQFNQTPLNFALHNSSCFRNIKIYTTQVSSIQQTNSF